MLIKDLSDQGGKITLEDFKSYKLSTEEPHLVHLDNNLTLFSAKLPASGPVLGLIVSTMLRADKLRHFDGESLRLV